MPGNILSYYIYIKLAKSQKNLRRKALLLSFSGDEIEDQRH